MAKKHIFVSILIVFVICVYFNNSNVFSSNKKQDASRFLMAHRGVHQNFHREKLSGETCTATRIFEPVHDYIENTIPSMRAAFEAGADMVELDVKITKDRKLAVFHDAGLDCRTNSSGAPWQYTMAELKTMDIAYGYTANQGKTFPFRGRGVGMMPSLKEVLDIFPDKAFLIHIKTKNPLNADLLAALLSARSAAQNSRIVVYGGGGAPTARLRKLQPSIRSFTRESVKSCLKKYMLMSWAGIFPKECKNTFIAVPMDYTGALWGWPERFVERMNEHNTQVFLLGSTQPNTSFFGGIDSKELVEKIPKNYRGGIWTNRIEMFKAWGG